MSIFNRIVRELVSQLAPEFSENEFTMLFGEIVNLLRPGTERYFANFYLVYLGDNLLVERLDGDEARHRLVQEEEDE